MSKTLNCRASVALLFLASLLLIIAIATPGWSVVVNGNSEELASVFYSVHCDIYHTKAKSLVQKCTANSYLALFNEHRDFLKERAGRRETIGTDHEYHVLVLRQVLTVTSAALSILVFLLQASRRGSLDRFHVRLIIASIVTSAVVVGVLLTVLAREIVDQAYQFGISSLDSDRDHTYIGFPYSLLLVFGSVIMHAVAMVTMGAHLYTPKQRGKGYQMRLSESDLEFNTEPEMDTHVSKYQYDNPILCEKL